MPTDYHKVNKAHSPDRVTRGYYVPKAHKVVTKSVACAHPLGSSSSDPTEEIVMTTSEFMNVRDTAKALDVHENTIRNWEKNGVLHGIKLPGSGFRRFARSEVERMRAEMRGAYAPATEMPEMTSGASGRVVDGDLL